MRTNSKNTHPGHRPRNRTKYSSKKLLTSAATVAEVHESRPEGHGDGRVHLDRLLQRCALEIKGQSDSASHARAPRAQSVLSRHVRRRRSKPRLSRLPRARNFACHRSTNARTLLCSSNTQHQALVMFAPACGAWCGDYRSSCVAYSPPLAYPFPARHRQGYS